MKTFEFSIIASGLDPEADDFESRFFDSGCDDGTVSFQKGRIIVDFAREAASVDEAISSAISNVLATGAAVERVEPDPLVSLSDIASRSHLSRAAVSHYALGQRQGGFPAPRLRVTSSSPLWQWPDVADWLFRHDKLSRDEAVQAVAVAEANEVLREAKAGRFADELKLRVKKYEAAIAAE
jgi:hypothetical protein